MKKLYLVVVVAILIAACKQSPGNDAKTQNGDAALNQTEKNIYRSGDSMLAAFKRRDWLTFVKYNHPNMTKRMGGAEAFASFINTQMKQIPDTAIINLSLGKILQVVTTPADEQCVVEQNLNMVIDGNKIDKKTYLVGQSLDKGNSWTFFDASTKTTLSPRDIKPDLSKDLKIPETTKN